MKKLMRLLLIVCMITSLVGCSTSNKKPKVIIYTTVEDFRSAFFLEKLEEKFPMYDIIIQYITSGSLAARLKNEKNKIEADIILGLEYTYLNQVEDSLAPLDDYDFSKFIDDVVPASKRFVPMSKYSGSIIINPSVLEKKGLPVPNSYADLLKPEYKNLISMPNPKSSSTGYMFLKNLVNVMGEEEAFKYFDELSKNVLQFTSSGSGPVKALVQGEVAIGLGMTFQAVNQINDGVNLEIHYFDEGAPYALEGAAMVLDHQNKPGVKEVFDYIFDTLIYEDKQLFLPEPIFKDQHTEIDNFPNDIPYGDMSNNSESERLHLLRKWEY